MAEHHELVAEMQILEQMGTQERQKLAKKRRLQQLKKWSQREKEWIAKEKQMNKRLANSLNEENNGLNLKCYTVYGNNNNINHIKTNNNINTKLDNNSTTANSNKYNNSNNAASKNGIYNKSQDAKHPHRAHNKSSANREKVNFEAGVMLLEAASRNDVEEVKRLFSLGVSPNSVNHDGLTALHQCCIDASEVMMNLLLEYGANVDAHDMEHWTPLHAACTCGHLNLVKRLVESGADVLAVNGDGNLPFDICEDEATLDYIESEMVNKGITQELIDKTRASTENKMLLDIERKIAKNKDLNFSHEGGVTLLHVAAANGYNNVTQLLLANGVNVNSCDNDFWTPLHGAACWGTIHQHESIVNMLVESGADLSAKTINDETPLDLCDNEELLERLNHLKDEMEKNEVNDLNKLKFQSNKSHRRMHSVRRTSVREKNQTSRREARQEALLRVDSSTNDQNTLVNKQSDNINASTTNGTLDIGGRVSNTNGNDSRIESNNKTQSVREGMNSTNSSNMVANFEDNATSNCNMLITSNSSSQDNFKQTNTTAHIDPNQQQSIPKKTDKSHSDGCLLDNFYHEQATDGQQDTKNLHCQQKQQQQQAHSRSQTLISRSFIKQNNLSSNNHEHEKYEGKQQDVGANLSTSSTDDVDDYGRLKSYSDSPINNYNFFDGSDGGSNNNGANERKKKLSAPKNNDKDKRKENDKAKKALASSKVINTKATSEFSSSGSIVPSSKHASSRMQANDNCELTTINSTTAATMSTNPDGNSGANNGKAATNTHHQDVVGSCRDGNGAAPVEFGALNSNVDGISYNHLNSLAPAILTLANLKKQRSDLRNNRQFSTLSHQQNVAATGKNNCNGTIEEPSTISKAPSESTKACQSPDTTLRRFRGDPRDVIGGGFEDDGLGGSGRRECCIII